MQIPLDVMMGRTEVDKKNCSEFVSDLQDRLETAYSDVRHSLKVGQRLQKDAYDKGVRHMAFRTGNLGLHYTPQLKPGEANKFHRQWEGPFEIVERITDVTYRGTKVRGHFRRSQVVHFTNLRLYQRRQEERIDEPAVGGSLDAQGGSDECEQVSPACGEVESVEPDTVTGEAVEEAIGVAARNELFDEVVDVRVLIRFQLEKSSKVVNMIK